MKTCNSLEIVLIGTYLCIKQNFILGHEVLHVAYQVLIGTYLCIKQNLLES